MSNAAMVSQVSKERNKKIVQQPIDLLYRSELKIRLCY
jgi:hypothetical protein